MRGIEIGSLALKLMGIYAIVRSIHLLHSGLLALCYVSFDRSLPQGLAASSALLLGFPLIVGLAVLLIRYSDGLAERLITSDSDASLGASPCTSLDIQAIAFSAVGAFVLLQAVLRGAHVAYSLTGSGLLPPELAARSVRQSWQGIAALGTQALLGVVLFVRARHFAIAWHRLQGLDEQEGRSMERNEFQKIEGLIGSLELCHHKAKRHVDLIIEAIGKEGTGKGYQGSETERQHPATHAWQNAVDILSAWVSGDTTAASALRVFDMPADQLIGCLGDATPLKRWQVQQIVRKIKAASRMYPGAEYSEMADFPDRYGDESEFLEQTMNAVIHDTVDGEPAEISLAAAIDHLQPCNWNFPANLLLVLKAINGDLSPAEPFAAHGRNAKLNPIRPQLRVLVSMLNRFCGDDTGDVDEAVLTTLGTPSADKQSLARSLAEKLREFV